MTESQIRTLFSEMADGEPPPSRVDPELARRRSRARLRWRRASIAATSALAAAAVAATAVTAAPLWHGSHQAAAAGPSAPRLFNPLVPYVSFGWLPPGEAVVGGGTGQAEMYLTAAPRPDSLATWDLSAYAAGQCKLAAKRLACSPVAGERLSVEPASTITRRAPAVHGKHAFWTTTGLVWQYARGGWASLTFPYPFDFQRMPTAIKRGTVKPGTTRATVKHDAVRIAGHVKLGAATPPLLFPAQLTGLPSQWLVSGTTYVPDGSALRVRTYALNADPAAGVRDFDGGLTFQDNLPWIQIDPAATRHNPCLAYPKNNKLGERSVHQTINGHRVIVSYQDTRTVAFPGVPSHPLHRQQLCSANAGGLTVGVSENGAHPAIGVVSLFKDHLRLLGANPANWTRRPIG